jgi:hypothetical protein
MPEDIYIYINLITEFCTEFRGTDGGFLSLQFSAAGNVLTDSFF